jgi:virginiamycin A acetyltransferase
MLKGLIPEVLLLYRTWRRYTKAFPDAFVSSEASVDLDAKIGTGCIVRAGCTVSKSVALGRYSTLGDNCLLRGGGRIEIGPFCSIGPEVVMISENHAFDRLTTFPLALYKDLDGGEFEFTSSDISIQADVWVGQRAVVLAGARIGSGCVIGAGSVVPRGEYEPYTVLAGVPARPIKKRLDEASRQALLDSEWWSAPTERIFGDWAADLRKSSWDDACHLGRI